MSWYNVDIRNKEKKNERKEKWKLKSSTLAVAAMLIFQTLTLSMASALIVAIIAMWSRKKSSSPPFVGVDK